MSINELMRSMDPFFSETETIFTETAIGSFSPFLIVLFLLLSTLLIIWYIYSWLFPQQRSEKIIDNQTVNIKYFFFQPHIVNYYSNCEPVLTDDDDAC